MEEARRGTIVVIEDEEPIRSLLEAILRGDGYRVVATGDPRLAVEIALAESPDLVLCDIAMPEMDGYGVLKALQDNPATVSLPVVFLTAHREFSERVRAFRFGVVDFVAKPFTRDILLRKVEKILDGLDRRPGVVSEAGGTEAVRDLLESVHREGRTGILDVTNDAGGSRVVIEAGAVAGEAAEKVLDGATAAEFREIDPTHEQLVVRDPDALPGGPEAPPHFETLPALVRTVLVVDDNAVFRKFLRDILSAQGFTVHEAASGDEGLRVALARKPWLILTDLNMPGLDGFEFCRSIRSHSLIRHTPVIFLSGWDDYQDRSRGLEAGADDYLPKQIGVRELLIRIHLILKRYSDVDSRFRERPGMEGRIEVVGPTGLLQMCHLGRFTGICTARSGSQRLEIRFREGQIVGAERQGLTGVAAIHDFLSWGQGHFEFVPGDPGPGGPLGTSFDQLILEGCRILDESRRAGLGTGERA